MHNEHVCMHALHAVFIYLVRSYTDAEVSDISFVRFASPYMARVTRRVLLDGRPSESWLCTLSAKHRLVAVSFESKVMKRVK